MATAGALGGVLSPRGALSLPAPTKALVAVLLVLPTSPAVDVMAEDGVMVPAAVLVCLVVVIAAGGAGLELGVGRHCAWSFHYLE